MVAGMSALVFVRMPTRVALPRVRDVRIRARALVYVYETGVHTCVRMLLPPPRYAYGNGYGDAY